MATLKDISKETGISITQVSRALGGFDDVNAETRRRVEEAAAKLGYRANLMARGLKTGQSGNVAMVVPRQLDASAREVLFEVVWGISAEFSRRGKRLILHVTAYANDISVYDQLYRSGGVDGFVVIGPTVNDPRIVQLADRGIPFVVHGRDPSCAHDFVDLDNAALIGSMVSAARKLGHADIAFLNGPADLPFAQARARGFDQAVKGAGDCRILNAPMTFEAGHDLTISLLTGKNPPSAIIAGNLMMAAGVYAAVKEAGLQVPRDLSVLAHDDGLEHYDPDAFDPPIGGTRSELGAAWSALASSFDRRITHPDIEAQVTELEFEFRQGASIQPPRE
ncbi:LacI family DNA-binding transcriptional regulator [Thioclava sp. JE_KL1]|uniref:LacI family DNA-binding transcriptional regulator n=1 Tax=Thioclava sp. JE_KL1 TaxID=2651187 RepID=UPI00156235E4|nr:LacI family DNA-binding transcriptional regulator [Thioclava sp. JE_KL1]